MWRDETLGLLRFVTIVLTDWLTLAIVWILLYLFQFLCGHLRVKGFAARWIEALHEAGSVIVVLLLVVFLLIDVFQELRK